MKKVNFFTFPNYFGEMGFCLGWWADTERPMFPQLQGTSSNGSRAERDVKQVYSSR